MRVFLAIGILGICFLGSCKNQKSAPLVDDEQAIGQCLDNWHKAAAAADLDAYLGYMSSDAIFIGTDAKERWTLDSFKAFCKPYFDRGKAWNFTPLKRHIMLDSTHQLAWMDELLRTQMKICRGSAVLRKEQQEWKIVHYVLSMTIPNELTDTVVPLKAPIEDSLIQVISGQTGQ